MALSTVTGLTLGDPLLIFENSSFLTVSVVPEVPEFKIVKQPRS
jgi:hypothetical protein